jgi:hypothetical protein
MAAEAPLARSARADGATRADREPDEPHQRAGENVPAPSLHVVGGGGGSPPPVIVGNLNKATGVTVAEQNIGREARSMTDGAGHDHHLRDSSSIR